MREELKAFAEAMELKLQKKEGEVNDGEIASIDWLVLRAKEEMIELLEALRLYHMMDSDDTRSRVLDECVDIASYMMFIANKVKEK